MIPTLNSLYELFSPGASTATEATPSPVVSHGAKAQLLYQTPLRLQSQYHLGDSYTGSSSSAGERYSLAISRTQLLCAETEKRSPEDFSSVVLVLSLDNSSAPLTSIDCPSKATASFNFSIVTADFLSPAEKNHRFLIQNREWPPENL